MAQLRDTIVDRSGHYLKADACSPAYTHDVIASTDGFAHQFNETELRFAGTFPPQWTGHPGYRQCAAWPVHFDRCRFSRAEMRDAVAAIAGKRSSIAFLAHDTNRPLDVTHDGYECEHGWINMRGEPEHVRWQVRRSGFIYQRAAFSEDLFRGDLAQYVSTDALVAHVANAIDAVGRAYEGLIPEYEDVSLRFRVSATKGRYLTSELDESLSEYPCTLLELISDSRYSAGELRSRRATIVTAISADLIEQCGRVTPSLRGLRTTVDRHLMSATSRRLSHQL